MGKMGPLGQAGGSAGIKKTGGIIKFCLRPRRRDRGIFFHQVLQPVITGLKFDPVAFSGFPKEGIEESQVERQVFFYIRGDNCFDRGLLLYT